MKRIVFASYFLLSVMAVWGIHTIHAAPLGYIDPNTGGMLAGILVAAFTFLSGFIFFFSSRIKMTLARMRRSVREQGEQPTEETNQENS